jgi:shikimate 5-dehydrogenase
MKRLGLLGKKISHSKSPAIYQQILKVPHSYQLIDVDETSIPSVDELLLFDGLNITSPYKKTFINVVKIKDGSPSINCLKKTEHGFEGINTDRLALKTILLNYQNHPIIILGGGVMAEITEVVLKELRIPYQHFQRKFHGDLTFTNFSMLPKKAVFLNTCSRDFLFQGQLPPESIFYDYNYAADAQKKIILDKGGLYRDGEELLLSQADHAVKFWSF